MTHITSSNENNSDWAPGLEVIKVEFSLRLKIKPNEWLLIIALYFESENELKFDNLEARYLVLAILNIGMIHVFHALSSGSCLNIRPLDSVLLGSIS